MDVPPRSSRRNLPFLLGLVAILALLPLGYFRFLHEPPAPPPAPLPVPVLPTEPVKPTPPPAGDTAVAPGPAERKPVELKIQKLEGRVEVRRGDGDWSPAQQDEVLRPSDRVRTLEGSYAVLVDGEALEIHMEEGTEVSVDELTDSISRFMLANGMTTVTTRPGTKQTLEMRTAGSEARVSTEGGRFTLSNDGRGTVALATLSGETRFSGPHNLIIVRAGQQSIVRPGQEPSLPIPIPSSLLLKVKWPARAQRRVTLSGETEPGALVIAGGQRVSADDHGRFALPLQLKEGPNPVKVRVRSVGGQLQQDQRDLSVDTTPPKGVTVDPGLWGDP